MRWTEAQVSVVVTDAGTLKRGQGLASPSHWSNLGFDEQSVWGECAGSGSKPYQVIIDLAGPAFKCSCPSRVFPCKHGAGLMLLDVRNPSLLTSQPAPAWVAEWMDKRRQKQEASAQPKEEKPVDAAAQAKRDEKRNDRMAAGIDDFERWLLDATRVGIADLASKPPSWFESMAARLVDNQLPGLATRVRALAELPAANKHALVLEGLGMLYLLVRAFRNLNTVSEDTRSEVLQQLGLNLKRETVLAWQESVNDRWHVMGQAVLEEDKLTTRRVWLWGEQSKRYALLLDFSFRGKGFEQSFLASGVYQGPVVFYPGLNPLRAITAGLHLVAGAEADFSHAMSLDAGLDAFANALALNPWMPLYPVCFEAAVPELHNSVWYLRTDGHLLPMRCSDDSGWELAARAGGYPLTVFGEWEGTAFNPLSWHLSSLQPA